jgi:sigma-B regulation protein RsbU (phosphoserine phosphatase)
LRVSRIVSSNPRILSEGALAGQYATLVCEQAQPDGRVEIHNAGRLPAIVAGQGGVLRIESTGLPLGLFCEAEFSATRLEIDPSDTLFLFTDGLSEAGNADDEYGVERVMQLVRQHAGRSPSDLIAACLDDLNRFADPSAKSDGLTVLAIQRRAVTQ